MSSTTLIFNDYATVQLYFSKYRKYRTFFTKYRTYFTAQSKNAGNSEQATQSHGLQQSQFGKLTMETYRYTQFGV